MPGLIWILVPEQHNGPSQYSGYRTITTPFNPPSTTALRAPANNALITSYQPTFQWKPVVIPNFQNYIVQVSDTLNFSHLVVNEPSLTSTSFMPDMPFASNTTFFWRVRVVNTNGEMSNWSAVWTLRAAILPPTLLTPASGSTNGSRMPTLDWENVPGNTGYVLQIWRTGTTPVLVGSVTLSTDVSQYTFISNLLPNTSYYWKVQTKAANGPSLWSSNFYFTTGP